MLKNKKTCPEESIFQIGTLDNHVPPELLFEIVTEFMIEINERFGSHVHILDWALHLKVHLTSTSVTFLTVKISTVRLPISKKKLWKHWDLNYLIRRSHRAEKTTEK